MCVRLTSNDPDFETRFKQLITARQASSDQVDQRVADIIAQICLGGDQALIDLTHQFDGVDLHPDNMRIAPEIVAGAIHEITDDLRTALTFAAKRIETYHRRQVPQDNLFSDEFGVELGYRWTAIEAAGIYVPGGTAAYPSSVLMNAIPARVAGVSRIIMCTPAKQGKLSPAVLAAAHIAGVDEIYQIGGAQAIAAMAHGTATIRPVDIIAGPGNAYVTAAKRQLFGKVGIDMLAGPSEVLIVTDRHQRADWIAADLLSQAEHDPHAQAIAIVDDASFGDAIAGAIDTLLPNLPRQEIAQQSWQQHGAIICVADLAEAPNLVNRIAPEHLQLVISQPESMLPHIRNAGAIFLGAYTPEAVGDYVAGSNHVLPTTGSARYASGLSVFNFLKRSSVVKSTAGNIAQLAPAAICIAEAEGLDAHAYSLQLRLHADLDALS